ncbi:MAG: CPBP family intramembrane metalloprotease [Bacteroidales bacterium]|nr:CPBP family intramembrane metalloprotease [Bacteroidales bacterium]
MAYGLFHTARPFTKILLVLFLMVTTYLIFSGIGILLAWPIFKIPPSEVIGIIENRDTEGNIELLKFLQVLYSIGLFMVPALLAGFLIQKNTWDYLKANRSMQISLVILVFFLMIVSIPWINYLGFLNEKLSLPERWSEWMEKIRQNDESSWELMRSYLAAESFWGLLFNLFMISLIPAIGEEFLFRGMLQRIFSEWFRNGHMAVWLAAILFSLAHYQFLGFIPRILLGAMFGYLFLWTGNIWLPVLAHFVNNAVAVVYYYLFLQGSLRTDPEQIGMQQNPVLFIMGSLFLTIIGLMAIQQIGKISTDSQPG